MKPLDNYGKKLDELGAHPDKTKINGLSMVAREVVASYIPGFTPRDVLNLIFKKIMRASGNKKVPLWYVLDSILFNVKGDYLSLINSGMRLPVYFQDTYRCVNEDDKKRLERLLYRWEKRDTFIDKSILHETRARLHPNFDEVEYRAYIRHKAEKQSLHIYSTNRTNIPPPQNNSAVSFGGNNQSQSIDVNVERRVLSEQQYTSLLYATAAAKLKETQASIPENQQLDLQKIQIMKPSLYLQLVERAHEDLERQGFLPANPTLKNYGKPNEDNFAQPNDINWNMQYLRSGTATEYVLSKLFDLEVTDSGISEVRSGRIRDEKSGLNFGTENSRLKYHSNYGDTVMDDKDIFVEDRKLCETGHRSRAWLQSLELWLEEGEEFEQVYSVDREFDPSATSNPNFNKNSDPTEKEPDIVHKVVADESYPNCFITGEPLEKAWDDDLKEWVYLNAIRPKEDGPIYNFKAYLRSQEQEKSSIHTTSDVEPLAKKQKI